MISKINLKGFAQYGPLADLNSNQRMLLEMGTVRLLVIILIISIDPVLNSLFYKYPFWKIDEVFLFGVIYVLLIFLIRKTNSIFHFFIFLTGNGVLPRKPMMALSSLASEKI